MKILNELWKRIKHNQTLVFSSVLCMAVVVWLYGCESVVQSIQHPTLKISRAELHLEVESMIAQAEQRFKSLDQQDRFKNALFQMAIDYAKGGNVNPVAVAVTLGNILGIGAIVDNRRKDQRIRSLKKEIQNGKEKIESQTENPVEKTESPEVTT